MWQIKYIISSPAEGSWAPSQARCWLTVRESYHKSHMTFDHVTNMRSLDNWKIYISTITRLMVSKPGRVLTYGRRFSTQTLNSSPTSCYLYFYGFSRTGRTPVTISCDSLLNIYLRSICNNVFRKCGHGYDIRFLKTLWTMFSKVFMSFSTL